MSVLLELAAAIEQHHDSSLVDERLQQRWAVDYMDSEEFNYGLGLGFRVGYGMRSHATAYADLNRHVVRNGFGSRLPGGAMAAARRVAEAQFRARFGEMA